MISAFLMAQQAPPPAQEEMTDEDWALGVVRDAMAAGGWDGMPKVQFEDPDHWAFRGPAKGQQIAKALRDRDGREFIIINNQYLPLRQTGRVQHEVGHIGAWRNHGIRIKEHGPQFMKTCRKVVSENPNKNCKGFF